MKEKDSMAKMMLISIVAAMMIMIVPTSCDKDDANIPTDNAESDSLIITTYNDLSFFQSAIIEIDEEGNEVQRNVGSVLNTNEPMHLFVGADSIEEARDRFLEWIAPDSKITEREGNLDVELTDEDDNSQGTIYFRIGTSDNHIAEVTASETTELKHFSQITFLDRDDAAWPRLLSGKKYAVGDIVYMKPKGISDYLSKEDKGLYFICIREQDNDQPGIWCAFTSAKFQSHHPYNEGPLGPGHSTLSDVENEDFKAIRTSKYCPGEQKALMYAKIFNANLSFFRACLMVYGGQYHITPIHDGSMCWYDHTHGGMRKYYDAIQYTSGFHYGEYSKSVYYQFLLKVDWLTDDKIENNAEI